MSKKRSPAFQFYAADYLADENVQLMSMEEEGCYVRLLAYCWREGSVPAEPEKLARLCKGVTPSEAVMGCFVECEGYPSRLANPRLEEERLSKLEFAEKCKQWGKLGAHKRKGNKEKSTERVGLATIANKKIALQSSSSSSNNNLSNDRLLDGATLPTPAAEVFTELPCTGKAKTWPVTKSYIAEMAPLYPGIDIEAEILRAKGWLLNNPKKRKTDRGMTSFLGRWFTKEQDKARSPTLPVRVAPDTVGEPDQPPSPMSERKLAMIEIECEDDPERKAKLLADYKRKFETTEEVA